MCVCVTGQRSGLCCKSLLLMMGFYITHTQQQQSCKHPDSHKHTSLLTSANTPTRNIEIQQAGSLKQPLKSTEPGLDSRSTTLHLN